MTQAKQNRTLADIQTLAAHVELAKPKGVRVDEHLFEQIVEEKGLELDAWGNKLRFVRSSEGESYLIVSFGRDGRLDVDDEVDYFSVVGGSDIRGDADHDIVVIDGRSLFLVGK